MIFQSFSGDQMDLLLPLMVSFAYHPRDVIFQQDQPALFFYILLEGEVLIRYKPYDGPPLTVNRIFPGEVFGWSAALRRPVYTANAVALTRIQVLRMGWHELHRLYGEYPETGKLFIHALASCIAEKIGNSRDQVLAMLRQGLEIGESLFK